MSGRSGFSLIEVLVAFAVVALTLAVAVPMFGQGLRGLDRAGQAGRALLVAENRLAEVGSEIPLVPGQRAGRADGLNWRVEIGDLQPDRDPRATLATFAVAVVVGDSGGRALVRLATVRLAPVVRR